MRFKGKNNGGHTSEHDVFMTWTQSYTRRTHGILLKFYLSEKTQKTETPKQDGTQNGKLQKIQGSSRSKDREIELIYNEVRIKRKEKFQIYKLRVQTTRKKFQIHELRVQIYELWVQIDEVQLQIHELRVQIHES